MFADLHLAPRSARAWRSRLVAILAVACVMILFGGPVQAQAAPAHTSQAHTARVHMARAQASSPVPIYLDNRYSFAERAADLVSRMTLSEKVQQLHTNNAPAISRLGVQ